MRAAAPVPSVDGMSEPSDAQVWELTHEGRHHRVVAHGSVTHRVRWWVDEALVATRSTVDDTVRVTPDDGSGVETRLVVRFSALGSPRSATLDEAGADLRSLTGLGGVDLVPEPGSRAAAHEDRVLAHPTRFALVATLGGVAKVVVPIVLSLLVVRFAVSLPWPSIPLPDLPDVPWPDLPAIPWPDLPDVPLPDVPVVPVPAWVEWLLGHVKYVWPVVLAFVLARGEVKRRREQAERRREQAEDGGASGTGTP